MKFSIIVPIYNVEKYLRECIDSILLSDHHDLEIILVDDGSTDESPQICDEYAAKYNRVNVIHTANSGPSAARNIGLKSATGEYVLFVDSDDWIDASAINVIAKLVKNSVCEIDLMFLEAMKVYGKDVKRPLGDDYIAERINGREKADVMAHLSSLPKFPGSACNKLFRREFLIKNNIYFREGIYNEDIDLMITALTVARRFAYCPQPYYFYRQNRPGSRSGLPNEKSFVDLLDIIQRYGDKKTSVHQYQPQINAFLAYEYVVALFLFAFLPKDARRKHIKQMRSLRWVLRFGRSRKTKLVRIACAVLGIFCTARVLRFYRSIIKIY